ncbi:MAG: transglycosylase SLT domain-containing protein [Myxococcota bacterium]|nr:transglycosylase SLT domain-containing protein [Myxococcota bacterium]
MVNKALIYLGLALAHGMFPTSGLAKSTLERTSDQVKSRTWLPQAPQNIIRRASQHIEMGQFPSASRLVANMNSNEALFIRAWASVASGELTQAKRLLPRLEKQKILEKSCKELNLLVSGAEQNWAAVLQSADRLLKSEGFLTGGAWQLVAQALVHSYNSIDKLQTEFERFRVDKLSYEEYAYFLRLFVDAFSSHASEKLRKHFAQLGYTKAPTLFTEADLESTPPVELQIRRAESFVNLHQNSRVLETLGSLGTTKLTASQDCRLRFARGVTYRKTHNYRDAATDLEKVALGCPDRSISRRAHYVWAKVVSISDGLEAIPIMQKFLENYPQHTMVDDILFWAGDLYQRRNKIGSANAFYSRIPKLRQDKDHCADALWRMSWMAYRQHELPDAITHLSNSLESPGCIKDIHEKARAIYWIGRFYEQQKRTGDMRKQFEHLLSAYPLTFYGHLARHRLGQVGVSEPLKFRQIYSVSGSYVQAEEGEESGKSTEFRTVAHHAYYGLTPWAENRARGVEFRAKEHIGEDRLAHLISVAQTLQLVGKSAHGQLFLRRHMTSELLQAGSNLPKVAFEMAYPLAFRDELGAAESEQTIPGLLLQSIAREESAFNPEALSWAGAMGLVQLMPDRAKALGSKLEPPINISDSTLLFDPKLNARLGALLLRGLQDKLKGHIAMTLAAYNSTMPWVKTWWKRHLGDSLDEFVEDIPIRETRKYVKRVMQTWGIYQQLYTPDQKGWIPSPIPRELK